MNRPTTTRPSCVSWATAGGAVVGDARGSGEFRAVLVEELGHRARGAAGDLLKGACGVVVLPGQDRPLARDEQLSGPRRYPGAGQACVPRNSAVLEASAG